MAKLTREQERLHAQACQLIEQPGDLDEDQRRFVLNHWQESSTNSSASDRAFFTPEGLARDMSIEVGGNRIIDLAAGIGRLAHHNRDLWARWPHPAPEMVCVERNPEYVRVGRKVVPEATWICADVLDLPDMLDELGTFDCALANPPFGPLPRRRDAPGGYTGRRFEYHVIALASLFARRGVFIIPQVAAPFHYSGRQGYLSDQGDAEYHKFVAATGIQLDGNCGIDTAYYDEDWHSLKAPRVEIVTVDYTERAAPSVPVARTPPRRTAPVGAAKSAGQLALLGP